MPRAFIKLGQNVAYASRVNEFGCCWAAIAKTLGLGPFEQRLLKVEAFAECGVVEVEY
jgi:hypothetical protein